MWKWAIRGAKGPDGGGTTSCVLFDVWQALALCCLSVSVSPCSVLSGASLKSPPLFDHKTEAMALPDTWSLSVADGFFCSHVPVPPHKQTAAVYGNYMKGTQWCFTTPTFILFRWQNFPFVGFSCYTMCYLMSFFMIETDDRSGIAWLLLYFWE